jgi:hypothetical protein
MLPMERSVTFAGACANEIIPDGLYRSFVNKAKEGEEKQTTQWPKKQVQKDKQRSTKHRVTRTSLKTGGELRCSGRVSSSCSTRGTRRVNLVTNPVISRE